MIGMNLKYLRKKYGYSQEDLAERLEVSSLLQSGKTRNLFPMSKNA